MEKARNFNGEYVHIDDIDEVVYKIKQDHYFCPECNQAVYPLLNCVEKINHFRHYKAGIRDGVEYRRCCNNWEHEKTPWHKEWQDRFGKENSEVYSENSGETHFADVMIGDIVLEVQHSPISFEAFNRRNAFYKEKYKVIWLFDVSKEFEDGSIISRSTKGTYFSWDRPRRPFKQMLGSPEDITIFFQFAQKGTCIFKVSFSGNCSTFSVDMDYAYTIDAFAEAIKNGTVFELHPFSNKKSYKPEQNNTPEEEIKDGHYLREYMRRDVRCLIVEKLTDKKTILIPLRFGEFMTFGDGSIKCKYSWFDEKTLKYRYSDNFYKLSGYNKPIWRLKKTIEWEKEIISPISNSNGHVIEQEKPAKTETSTNVPQPPMEKKKVEEVLPTGDSLYDLMKGHAERVVSKIGDSGLFFATKDVEEISLYLYSTFTNKPIISANVTKGQIKDFDKKIWKASI